jgi:hypothetical protein
VSFPDDPLIAGFDVAGRVGMFNLPAARSDGGDPASTRRESHGSGAWKITWIVIFGKFPSPYKQRNSRTEANLNRIVFMVSSGWTRLCSFLCVRGIEFWPHDLASGYSGGFRASSSSTGITKSSSLTFVGPLAGRLGLRKYLNTAPIGRMPFSLSTMAPFVDGWQRLAGTNRLPVILW